MTGQGEKTRKGQLEERRVIINRKKNSWLFSEALRVSAVFSQMLTQMVYPNSIISGSSSHHRCFSTSLSFFMCGATAEEPKNLQVGKGGEQEGVTRKAPFQDDCVCLDVLKLL